MNSPVWALLDPRLKLSVLFSGVFWGPSVTLTVFRWVRAQWELWLLCTLVKTSVWRSVNEHWKALKHETASALCVRAEQKRFTTVFTHPTAKWTHNNLQLIALVNFKQTLQFFSLWCNDTCLYVVPAGVESQPLTFKQQRKGQGKGHH